MSRPKAIVDPRAVKLVIGWALLAVIVALVLSIPAFLVMVALTQLAAAFVTTQRRNGRLAFRFRLFMQPLRSLLSLPPAIVFSVLAAIAFIHANTSVLGILLN